MLGANGFRGEGHEGGVVHGPNTEQKEGIE